VIDAGESRKAATEDTLWIRLILLQQGMVMLIILDRTKEAW